MAARLLRAERALGLRYAFADFINPRGAPIAENYRSGFSPASASPSRGSRWPYGRSSPRARRAQVCADIEQIAAAYGADEAIVVTTAHDREARRRSYELLAEEFGQVPKAG